jgi:hypothetical protein
MGAWVTPFSGATTGSIGSGGHIPPVSYVIDLRQPRRKM